MMTLLVLVSRALLQLYVIWKTVEQVSGEWQQANRNFIISANDIADKPVSN